MFLIDFRHNESVHLQLKKHHCTICGKGFATRTHAKRHILKVCSVGAKPRNTGPRTNKTMENAFAMQN